MAKKNNNELIEMPKDIKDIKEEVLEYAKERIDIEIQKSFKKTEKKINSRKNFKLLRRDILIVILLIVIGFLTYELYNTGYFNKFIVNNKNVSNTSNVNTLENKDVEVLDEDKNKEKDNLINEHREALEKISISENSKYLKDFYSGKLNLETKLYLALANLDEDLIINDEDNTIINNKDLEDSYNYLFNDNSYANKSFTYGNNDFKYLKSQSIYLSSNSYSKESNNIKRVVIDIKIDDDNITLTSVDAIVDKDKVINILTGKEIASYKDDSSIKDNKNKLTIVDYTFEFTNDNYYLKSIKINNQ